ncbi:MAG: hypothetical protein Tsb002_30100 [Wenzhouxiangellaceae bacterium]
MMSRAHCYTSLCAMLFLVSLPLSLLAQVPTVFNYQGRLLANTAEQAPIAGTVDIDFSIWSGPASDGGATQLWSESWAGVGLNNGIFSVLLGSNGSPLNPADFQGDTTLYLQMAINGETMLPRQQLGAVPFAVVDEPSNEQQDLSLNSNTLALSDSAATVDLAPYLDNTDNQQLTLTGNNLQLSSDDGADSVDLTPYLDNADQDLSLDSGTDTLSLSGDATPVSLGIYRDNTDDQQLTLLGNNLQLTSDNGPDTADLSPFLDNTDNQALILSGNNLQLTSDDGTDTISLSAYLDNTDNQTLTLSGANLQLSSDDGTDVVNLSAFNNTDNQVLTLSGSNLQLTSDDGTDVVSLAGFTNTDNQTLTLSGNNLSISGSGSSVNLSTFLDNTDNQNLNNVLAQGNDAGGRNMTNVATITATGLNCPDCIQTEDIGQDEILGNDINDNIYTLYIDCNGTCANMSMRDSCNVIENLRNLTTNVELLGVSCFHGIPSTAGNGFVPCDDGTEVFSGYECRAFNLRTLGDIPCINGDGTDAIVTCLVTDIPL